MTHNDFNQRQMSEFLATIAKIRVGYRYSAITYAAHRQDGRLILIAAKLELSSWPLPSFTPYTSDHVVVDRVELDTPDLIAVIDEVTSGTFRAKNVDLSIPPGTGGFTFNQHKSTAYEDAVAVLRIPGRQHDDFLPYSQMTTELNSGTVHYTDFRELLRDKGLSFDVYAAAFEIVAWPIVRLACKGGALSRKIKLTLKLSPQASSDLITINGRTISTPQIEKWGKKGGELNWTSADGGLITATTWKVPKASGYSITVSYDNIVQSISVKQQPSSDDRPTLWGALKQVFPLLERPPLVAVISILGLLTAGAISLIAPELVAKIFETLWTGIAPKP